MEGWRETPAGESIQLILQERKQVGRWQQMKWSRVQGKPVAVTPTCGIHREGPAGAGWSKVGRHALWYVEQNPHPLSERFH